MKLYIFIVITFFIGTAKTLFSQEDRYRITIEYSPNLTRTTNQPSSGAYKIGQNALVRIKLNEKEKLSPTLGLGFLNTGALFVDQNGANPSIRTEKFIFNYNYIFLPIGVRFGFGNLFVLPEIGFGYNIFKKTKQVIEYQNGEVLKQVVDQELLGVEYSKLSTLMSLSVGTDFSIGSQSFSMGIKGFYGLSQIENRVNQNNNYFGFGLLIALKL